VDELSLPDGVTVGWLMGESFIVDQGAPLRPSERLADILLNAIRT